MTDADGHPTIAAIISAFTEADFDRVREIVRGGLEEGLAARTLLDEGLVAGISVQAISRNSDVPCLESGTYAAGPATSMSLYEAAAMAAPGVVSGGNVESGPPARAGLIEVGLEFRDPPFYD